ncbi:hypothetical protein BDV93DRAFT_606700 [Ceratobasidium sp. AG-I]|nr:hypothetical protein BDV93DRAFT_606700 [Ceratobasidium sp. AG-I]
MNNISLLSGGTQTSSDYALPFHEPDIVNLLVIGSFLYLLSVFHGVFQLLFGAGLVGQLILGAIYTIPLGNILPFDIQTSIGSIGYLGLLLLIVEGGLDARLDILSERRNLCVCVLVALSGIVLPIGLSLLVLHFGYQYSALESFVVGAALSSTSLGTTFAIMSSFRFPASQAQPEKSGVLGQDQAPRQETKEDITISDTRAGTILMGAALLDDIIGLVISSVVSNLGPTNSSSRISGWVVARPIVSSFLLLLVTIVLAKYIYPPISRRLSHHTRATFGSGKWAHQTSNAALFLFVLVISAYVTISHYVGSSMLIGAFCAGSLMSHCWKVSHAGPEHESDITNETMSWSPHHAFRRIAPVQNHILSPFFFASIGAAIPVRSLFRATTAWRGILYSALMVLAKVAAGGWLPIWTTAERRIQKTTTVLPAAPSWPAGLFVGFALVTRGEIGLLILNLAEGEELVSEEAFGVGIWAVVLNTLLGPMGVGRLLQTRAVEWVVGGPWGI